MPGEQLADCEGLRAKRRTLKKSSRLSSESCSNQAAATMSAAATSNIGPKIILPTPYEKRISCSHQALTELDRRRHAPSSRVSLRDIPWKSLYRGGIENVPDTNRLYVNSARYRTGYGSNNQFFRVSSDLVRMAGNQRYRNLLSRPSQERSSIESEATKSTSRKSSAKSLCRLARADTFNVTMESADSRDPLDVGKPQFCISPSIAASSKSSIVQKTSVVTANGKGHGYSRIGRHKIALTYDEAQEGILNRRTLLEKRTLLSDISVLLAFLGIVIMMFESELTARDVFNKESVASIVLKTLIVISTILLLVSILLYHSLEVQLLLIECGADDWKVTVSVGRIIKVMQECIICSICPFPGTTDISWPYLSGPMNLTSTITNTVQAAAGVGLSQSTPSPSSTITPTSPLMLSSPTHMTKIPLDVLLSIPMFLRCYLVGRSMVLHSKQFQDAATRTIAAMNQVNVNVKFVTRSLMKERPVTVIVIITTIYWLVISWCFTQCERYRYRPGGGEGNMAYLHSLWLIIVTFLSIGYGDMVPHTFCGRALASITGIVGIFAASALIATVTNMLELTKAEKHVNAFMADSNLQRLRNDVAATVLQHTWLIHKYRILKIDEVKARFHQRKFLDALRNFRRLKWEQRKLAEENNRLIDASQINNGLQARMSDLQNNQEVLLDAVHGIRARMDGMEMMLRQISMERSCREEYDEDDIS